jgi:hypothetical protein
MVPSSKAVRIDPVAAAGGTGTDDPTEAIARLVAVAEGLDLLLLFGSRARGEVHSRSDWDFGYLADERFDPDELLARLMIHLDADHVDLVDLARASGVLRYRAAAEAQVLHQAEPGIFERFWFEAVSFWCDAGPLIRRGQEAALARLDG